jgi:U3 small nucleolar RNA-associated protein 14
VTNSLFISPRHISFPWFLREAYHESVLLGNELTKKAMTLNEDEDPYRDDDDDLSRRRRASSGDGDDMSGRKSKKLRIVDEASESLDRILDSGAQDTELNGKYKALFEMDFMKKAREQQQLKAKEEAQQLLREIEEMEEGISESESDSEGKKEQQKKNQKKTKENLAKHKEKLEQARKQMTAALMNGNNNSMSLVLNQNGSSSAVAVAAATTAAVTQSKSTSLQNNPWLDPSVATKSRDVNAMIGDSSQGKVHQKAKQRNMKNAIIKSEDSAQEILTLHDENENANNDQGGKTGKRSHQSTKKSSGPPLAADADVINDSKTEQQPTRKPLLMQKSQQDLVNLAFAGPDYEADFEALKEKIIDEELNISDKKRKILSDGE